MKSLRHRFDVRDCASLAVALFSVVMIAVYWAFFGGQSGITYNVMPDVTYRFVAVPLAVGSVSFFLSSHFVVKVRMAAKQLFVAKAICLLLAIAYVACLISMLVLGRKMEQATAVALMLFMQLFASYVPSFVGLILGIRTDGIRQR